MKNLLIFLTVLTFSGCAQLNAAKIRSAVETVEETTRAVCMSADLFAVTETATPLVDTCGRILRTLSSDEYAAVAQVIDCVENESGNQRAVCIAQVEGWRDVAKKLARKLR
jgi:hypothetical protein